MELTALELAHLAEPQVGDERLGAAAELGARPCQSVDERDTERAMSRPSVESLRAGFDAFNRGDYDSWLVAFSEDVEVHDLAETPDTGVFYGHAGVRAWLAKLQEAWGDGFRFEPRSFTEGDGVVVADVRACATGIGGGVTIDMSVHLAFRLRDRKIVWTQGFLNRGAALEAVGLRE